ncbi:hypothetical protein OGM63_21245 [Plectonema radiosum NIES-515]|uniref:C-type lysozyme inhibitor domain-containing protein n=1 Tax=Plectonema radiosum NIES-515 TaxID=2986073 RepID=A0ABT3B3Q8_9CYAN|nr:hypothetical protein [Plectonema radiosum]MCV3216003.1 hypothetical protein [Plectonema radiosum NIES-515]
MKFLQPGFNYKATLKLALVSASSLFLLTPSVKAVPANNSEQLNPQPQICPSAKLLPKRSFDTAKYSVYICRGDNNNALGYYVRISKTDNSKITVPVTSTTGETYIASKGEIAYAVTPYELQVIKNRRVVLKERVNNAIAGDGQALAKGCPQGENIFGEAETKSFIVYICGSNLPTNYIAITRSGNRRIAVPLSSYNSKGVPETSQYIAVSGDIRYFLTRKVLKISDNGKTIIKEKVLHWN